MTIRTFSIVLLTAGLMASYAVAETEPLKTTVNPAHLAFYIVSGTGTFTLDDEEVAVGPGDVVFAPAGLRHRVAVKQEEPLQLLEFLDRPGLDQEFREWDTHFQGAQADLTLGQINEFTRMHGTVYLTIE